MQPQSSYTRAFLEGLTRLVEQVQMSDEPYYPGLEGVIAGETGICTVADGLSYRGYAIADLADNALFLDVAYLLLHGELPNQEFLADFQSIVADESALPDSVVNMIAEIPLHADMMDVLRTGISALAHHDPQQDDDSAEANIRKATRLLAKIPLLIATRYRISRGLDVLPCDAELGFAANLLRLITGNVPTAEEERAMEVSLILYAEHEFNASTFTARVVASTQSDLYSAVTAAVGALKGPLHGGANERVMAVLREVQDPDHAERWVREALQEKRRIMGFGHRVYKTGDPRAEILRHYCEELAASTGNEPLEAIAGTIETIVREEKGLPPNLDWPAARLYHYLGLDVELYTPLFVASRVLGWSAHVIEQAGNNRLIRPRARYVGPARREFIPLESRG